MSQLTFRSWARSGIYDLATAGRAKPRLRGALELELSEHAGPGRAKGRAAFEIAGPGEVEGLLPSAISRVVPPDGAPDAPSTRCAYVELAAPDLPWRYTPERPGSGGELRPWLVLVVGVVAAQAPSYGQGTPPEIELLADGRALIRQRALQAHDLRRSARWAHVQEDGTAATARILSPRPLVPGAGHLAVLVPAFQVRDGAIQDSWSAASLPAEIVLPCYHHWRFAAGEAGDFASIAGALEPAPEDAAVGASTLLFRGEKLQARGALAPLGSNDAPAPPAVASAVDAMRADARDAQGRWIARLPDYGEAWWAPGGAVPAWAAEANRDPRHRGAAGLGARCAVELQEKLVRAAHDRAGAIDVAAERVRHLAVGLAAARSLWRRRLPADPDEQIALFWSSMRRMVNPAGKAAIDEVAGARRPLPRALFSSAARRALRPRTALTRWAQPTSAAAVLAWVNRCPDGSEWTRVPSGLLHVDLDDAAAGSWTGTTRADEPAEIMPLALMTEEPPAGEPATTRADEPAEIIFAVDESGSPGVLAGANEPAPPVLVIDEQPADETITGGDAGADAVVPDPQWLAAVLPRLLLFAPAAEPCTPVRLDGLARSLRDAVDPTGAQPIAQQRVWSTIAGLDATEPLAPPEACVELDFAPWRYLREAAPDWLLPGVGQLPMNAVAAVATNRRFIGAFLVGLNSQLVAELRWRNLPLSSRCTPVRSFWGRRDPDTDDQLADIRSIEGWRPATSLGHSSHRPRGATAERLVIVFRSELFRRWPHTLVGLVAAASPGGRPDWHQPPKWAKTVLPRFQGAIGTDLTFFAFPLAPSELKSHWVMLEEASPGFGFSTKPTTKAEGPGGDAFAAARLARPQRVLIAGAALAGS